MKDLPRAGRRAILAALMLSTGSMLSGCAGDEVPTTATDAQAPAAALAPSDPAVPAGAPPVPAAIPKAAPLPSLYTETVCKIRDGRALPPNVASSAYNCLKARMRYAQSEHPLAKNYDGWSRLDGAPFFSKVHGNRYVAVFANDRALTTLTAAPDAPIVSGVAMATPTFSLSEDGTLEPGPLYVLEKMQKGFDTPSGNWRYTVIGPEGDIIGVTKGQHSEEVDFCKGCNRKSADAVYLALLRGQAPSELVKRDARQNFDPSKERIDPTIPILDPNAPLGAAGGAASALPAPALSAAPAFPPTPTAAPIGGVGGPVPVPGAPGQPPAPPLLDPNAPIAATPSTLDPSQPVLDPNAPSSTGAVLDPTQPVLDPTKSVLDPTKPVLDPGTQPIAAAPALNPATPITPAPLTPAPILGGAASTGSPTLAPAPNLAPPDPNLPVLDPNATPPDPGKAAPVSGGILNPDAPITEQTQPLGSAPATPSASVGDGVQDSEDPITEQSIDSGATPTTPTVPVGGGLLNPDAPIAAQPIVGSAAPTTPAAPVGSNVLNPEAPISAQPLLGNTAPVAPAVPVPGGTLNPDAPIGAQPLIGGSAKTPTRTAALTPVPSPASTAPLQPVAAQRIAGNLENPDLPIQQQEISGYFK